MNLSELVGVLGHELRTPLAAIIGYQELLSDGIYGELNERQHEPVTRILHSAYQLQHLVDGLQDLVQPGSSVDDELVSTSTADLLTALLETARPYAAGRSVTLNPVAGPATELSKVPAQRFLRAADLMLVAAVKASTGRTLELDLACRAAQLRFAIAATAIDPEDHPAATAREPEPPLNATRLRLAMAHATITAADGTLQLLPGPRGTDLLLCLPLAPAAPAAPD